MKNFNNLPKNKKILYSILIIIPLTALSIAFGFFMVNLSEKHDLIIQYCFKDKNELKLIAVFSDWNSGENGIWHESYTVKYIDLQSKTIISELEIPRKDNNKIPTYPNIFFDTKDNIWLIAKPEFIQGDTGFIAHFCIKNEKLELLEHRVLKGFIPNEQVSETQVKFLNELKQNNNKDWFENNKTRYKKLREYFIGMIATLIDEVSEFEPSVKFQDAKKSVFRINRDVRFSNDKSPYKTNFGGFIVPSGSKEGAGYYIHFEPDNCFIGGGIHCPENSILKILRESIYRNIDEFLSIIENDSFKNVFGTISGEKLKNPPQGFDKKFEHIDLLKFKEYTAIFNLENDSINEKNFLKMVVEKFKIMSDFIRFLNKSLT